MNLRGIKDISVSGTVEVSLRLEARGPPLVKESSMLCYGAWMLNFHNIVNYSEIGNMLKICNHPVTLSIEWDVSNLSWYCLNFQFIMSLFYTISYRLTI